VIILPGPSMPQSTDTIVSIDGLLFGLEIDGVAWIFEDLKGWTMGGGVETNFTPRPGRHGMHDGPAYRRQRVISISGACVADSAALAEQANDALSSLLADGSMGTFTVQNSRRVLSARVRLSDEPLDEWLGDDTAFRWSLQFTAPDYRKYGELVPVPTALPGGGSGLSWPIGSFFDFGAPPQTGSVVFTNTGTAPTEPTVTITGPLESGFQVVQVETGRRLRYEAPVSGELVLDNAEGTATAGGQDRTGLLTADDFFTVEPGATSTFQWSSLGSETSADPALMTVAVAPAYY
jgi:hypothetical protein